MGAGLGVREDAIVIRALCNGDRYRSTQQNVNNGSGGESTTRAEGLPVWVALGRMRVISY